MEMVRCCSCGEGFLKERLGVCVNRGWKVGRCWLENPWWSCLWSFDEMSKRVSLEKPCMGMMLSVMECLCCSLEEVRLGEGGLRELDVRRCAKMELLLRDLMVRLFAEAVMEVGAVFSVLLMSMVVLPEVTVAVVA